MYSLSPAPNNHIWTALVRKALLAVTLPPKKLKVCVSEIMTAESRKPSNLLWIYRERPWSRAGFRTRSSIQLFCVYSLTHLCILLYFLPIRGIITRTDAINAIKWLPPISLTNVAFIMAHFIRQKHVWELTLSTVSCIFIIFWYKHYLVSKEIVFIRDL